MGDANDAAKQLSKAALLLKEEETSDARFAALADAIVALASGVTQKAKAGGLKARDVLDLAKAVALAQKIRHEVLTSRRARKAARQARREGLD